MKLNEPSALASASYEVFCTDNVFQNFNTLTGYLSSGLALTSGLKEIYNSFGKYSIPSASYQVQCGTLTSSQIPLNFNNSDYIFDRILVTNAGLSSVNGTYKEYTSYNNKPRYAKNNYNQEIIWSGNQWVIFDKQDPNSMFLIYKSNSDTYYPSDAVNWDYYNTFTLNGLRYSTSYNPTPSLKINKKIVLDSGSGFFNLYIPPMDLTTGIYLSGALNTLADIFQPCLQNKISLIINYSGSTGLNINSSLIPETKINPGSIIKRKINEYEYYDFLITGNNINLTSGLSFTISNPGILPLDFFNQRGTLLLNNKYGNDCYFTGLIPTSSESSYVSLNNSKNLVNSEEEDYKTYVINSIYNNDCTGCFYRINFNLMCPTGSITYFQNIQTTSSVNRFSFVESYVDALDNLSNKICNNCLYPIILSDAFYTGDQSINLYNNTPSHGYTSSSTVNFYKYGDYDNAYLEITRDLKSKLLNLNQNLANNNKILEDDAECCAGVGCNYAYIGFGASTAWAKEKHEILAFTFKNPHEFITFNKNFSNLYFNLVNDCYISGSRDDNAIFLTNNVNYSVGNIYYKNPIQFRDCKSQIFPFNVYFAMRITPSISAEEYITPRGDGLTFIIQSESFDASGYNGGALGYAGIENSIGIGFDTFRNYSIDYNNNCIEIDLNGDLSNSVQQVTSPIDLADGRIKHVWIDYDENRNIKVYIEDTCCTENGLYKSKDEAIWNIQDCTFPNMVATDCGNCWECPSTTTTSTTTHPPTPYPPITTTTTTTTTSLTTPGGF